MICNISIYITCYFYMILFGTSHRIYFTVNQFVLCFRSFFQQQIFFFRKYFSSRQSHCLFLLSRHLLEGGRGKTLSTIKFLIFQWIFQKPSWKGRKRRRWFFRDRFLKSNARFRLVEVKPDFHCNQSSARSISISWNGSAWTLSFSRKAPNNSHPPETSLNASKVLSIGLISQIQSTPCLA